MKKLIKTMLIIILLPVFLIIGFKVGGTSYCYIKEPQTKEEANKIIDFCGRSDLLFSVLYSPTLAKKYEKFPDEFQNKGSSTILLTHYMFNRPLENLDKIEILTKNIAEIDWKENKKFYFILNEDFFEKNLPLDFRKKIFNELYEKYYSKIKDDNTIDNQKRNFLLFDINNLNKKLNNN